MHNSETGKYHGQGINYHDLGIDGLTAALESLTNPRNVMKSKKQGKIELVLQSVDKKGNSILSIVRLNAKTLNGKRFLDEHIVTSAYGRINIENYIKKADNEGRLIKQKEQSQGIPQVQYEGNINDHSFDNSISQPEPKATVLIKIHWKFFR